ncbi:MAG: hypothetical protein RRY29_10230 [Desulfovibrionaceae bacterium]
MKDITVTGMLQYGLCVDGVCHKDFELRLATLEDVENAIEDAGENACPARISRHKWAQTITSLGSLQDKAINADLLAGLESSEYGILSAAEDELQKKLVAVSKAPAVTSD